jgi:hypothetical protein
MEKHDGRKAGEMMPLEFDARYERRECANGFTYTFFCGASGNEVHTTGLICAVDGETALGIAKSEAQNYFNRCEQCGAWVSDAAFNIDEEKCLLCAPLNDIERNWRDD